MMKPQMKALILVAILWGVSDLRAQSHSNKSDVCHVLSLGMANRLLYVELDAVVESDGMHGAILTDAKCPGRGLFLDVTPDDADPSVAEFEKTLWSDGAPGTTGRRVSGTFFGKLRLDHKSKKLSISVQRVENLLNVRIDGKPQ